MLATTPLPPTVLDAAAAIAVPREAPADSFVLHAPLELMARVGLLPYLDAETRLAALARIETLTDRFTASGPAAPAPAPRRFDDPPAAVSHLAGAIAASDLDDVDATMIWLTAHAAPGELRQLLGEAVVDALGAAAHTPIGLYLLPTVASGRLPASLLRGPVRELARHPDWRLDWFRSASDATANEHDDLAGALRSVPHLGRPGSDFIFPLMSQAQQSGAAANALGTLIDHADHADQTTERHTLLRAAAWSMLHDDPEQAPYGWTHCLTMPQAVLALAGDGVTPRTALAVAATYVVGFRAAHGLEPLGRLDDAATIDAPTNVTDLVTFASLHDDAHVVKYTLACLLAADDDPAWAGTYLAAAHYLGEWWRSH
ncbi:MAG TPA: hypothetical protein VGO03_09725 [Acidimicrobiia bacterium]|jgi:hypothetical protein